MKKPVRKAGSMGKNRKLESNSVSNAVDKLIEFRSNPKAAGARPKGTRPAAPWAIQKGADMSMFSLGDKALALQKKSEQLKKAGKRMATAQKMQAANKAKIKK